MTRGTCVIAVGYKKGVTDPVGAGVARDIAHLKLGRVKGASSAQLYRLSGAVSAAERERIARDLLCDPVVQEFRVETREAHPKAPARSHQMPSVSVDVWFKPGVTDVAGESVLKGIRDLDVSGVDGVRTGMRYRLWGVSQAAVAEKIISTLLVNPLVHDTFAHAD